MSSTNHTSNYNLSQFIASDKPAWLVDYNGDMSKIDNAIKTNSDNIATKISVVNTNDIENGAVTQNKIADDAITTNKILNGNVTNSKIANLGVDSSKLAQNAVTTQKIEDGAVTGDKIDFTTLPQYTNEETDTKIKWLGKKLYSQVFTGTITASANQGGTAVITFPENVHVCFAEGNWTNGSGEIVGIGGVWINSSNAISQPASGWIQTNSTTLTLRVLHNQALSNRPYELIVFYTKDNETE